MGHEIVRMVMDYGWVMYGYEYRDTGWRELMRNTHDCCPIQFIILCLQISYPPPFVISSCDAMQQPRVDLDPCSTSASVARTTAVPALA